MKIPMICLLLAAAPGLPAAENPNIVFIPADAPGWRCLGVMGSTLCQTLIIDRLAEDGMRLTGAYAANPLCSQ
jgi:arylsulfatase A-like enzyme